MHNKRIWAHVHAYHYDYGSYPNFFLQVNLKNLEKFTEDFVGIKDKESIERFIGNYGIRRTSPEFWRISDWFHKQKAKAQPVRSGIFDLNRYSNL